MARVTISPRMPVGPQGAAAPEVQVQYSADGTNWHNTPQSGDMYLRFSTDGGDTWGEAIRLAEMAIDDQITDGVTDRAPSQNAVYNALQNYVLLSDYEDADVLAKIKNVDGENSGLDADLVRGLPADFTSSKATNGYQKLPSGLIIQWGKVAAGESGAVTITFPIVFPNQVFNAIAQMENDNSTEDDNSAACKLVDNTQMKVVRDSNLPTFWIAIGY